MGLCSSIRPLVALWVAFSIGLLAVPAAEAAPVQRRFEATLALFSNANLPPLFFSGAGSASVDVVGNRVIGLMLPANVFATQRTAATAGLEVRVNAANGAGSFTASTSSGTFGGIMPILGSLRICLGGPCDGSPPADVSLPLSVVGAGGMASTPGGTFRITGEDWGTSPVTLSGPGFVSIFSGYQLGPAGLTSSTALPGGFLSFVTPVMVTIPGFGSFDFVADLGVTLVPEPTALALMTIGLLGLARLGRSPAA